MNMKRKHAFAFIGWKKFAPNNTRKSNSKLSESLEKLDKLIKQ